MIVLVTGSVVVLAFPDEHEVDLVASQRAPRRRIIQRRFEREAKALGVERDGLVEVVRQQHRREAVEGHLAESSSSLWSPSSCASSGWNVAARILPCLTTTGPSRCVDSTPTPSPIDSITGARMKTAWTRPTPSTSTSSSKLSTWRP